MKISTKGRYALEAVFDLAIHSKDKHEQLRKVAERRGISENYLEQIFMHLKKEGIVKSIRGPQGGYVLAKEMESITCGEVIRAVEGKLSPVTCISLGNDKSECERYSRCVTKTVWEKMRDGINKIADSVTIKDLLDSYSEYSEPDQIEYTI